MSAFNVTVQQAEFDVGAVNDRMRRANPGIGAIASFVGVCRDLNDGDAVSSLWLEHYPAMTERAIVEILTQARQRWQLLACEVVHRVGELRPTDPIVLVVVASAHRHDAFEACAFIMDYLKTRAPFWKRESVPTGQRWVDARSSDSAAAARWRERSRE